MGLQVSQAPRGRANSDGENARDSRFIGPFGIGHVVEVARKHPFYSPQQTYPPTPDEVRNILSRRTTTSTELSKLSEFHVMQKADLYNVTERLLENNSPLNTFQDAAYVSISGGGGGTSSTLVFLTDTRENRAQRAACGDLMRLLGLLVEKDRVLAMHQSGKLYRSLDLTIDIVEFAGATVLPAGANTTLPDLLFFCKKFKPNTLSGDTSQIVNFASFVESSGEKDNLNITKILYTSEPMSRFQEAYIQSIFSKNGSSLSITSVLGSAETGVWAVSNFALTGEREEDSSDFIFDSRHMITECLPMDFDATKAQHHPFVTEHDNVGLLVVTSLQRLRNPLVRYFVGDLASVHQLPEATRAKLGGDTEHLRLLRLYGRDNRRSFSWEGEYFEFTELIKAFSKPHWGILRWQVILDNDPVLTSSSSIEIRVMRGKANFVLTEEKLVKELKILFCAKEKRESEVLFHVKFISADGFVRSDTGNKIVMFVDRRKVKK